MTRFGVNSPLLPIKSLGNFLKVYLAIGQNCYPIVANFFAFGQILIVDIGQMLSRKI